MFDELMKYYLDEFYKKGELILKAIVNCGVPSKIVLMYYPKCEPIEKLPEDKKRELWNFITAEFPDKSKDDQIRISKIVHTIGSLL